MKKLENSFYRPKELNFEELDAICKKLRSDLEVIIEKAAQDGDVAEYVTKLIDQGHEFKDNNDLLLWELVDPLKTCSEARVDYVAAPTRIAMAILVNTKLCYPEVADKIVGFDDALQRAMCGAAACGFSGHGYDFYKQLVKTMKDFTDWNILKVLNSAPTEFSEAFFKAKQDLLKVASLNDTQTNWFCDKTLIIQAKRFAEMIR